MKFKILRHAITGCICMLLFYSQAAMAQLAPAGIFGNNAVFQQGVPIPVWGKATPGARIEVLFAGHSTITSTNNQGKWMTYLPAQKADGNTYTLVIRSDSTVITYSNILMGEVWLASGQSNMAHKVGSELLNKEAEIQNARYPGIRFRMVDNMTAIVPADDIPQNDWKICNPQNVADFSSVAYFFARSLHLDQKIPVGVIVAARGATSIESWMSKDRLLTHPDFTASLSARDESPVHWNEFVRGSLKAEADREEIARTSFKGIGMGVTRLKFDDSGWGKTGFPLSAAKMGYGSYWGLIWIRKTFDLSATQSKKAWTLLLPIKDQNDIIYLNEKQLAKDVSSLKTKQVVIKPGMLIAGENLIAIRLYANWGTADIGDRTSMCYLESKDGERIELSGFWTHSNSIEPAVAGWQDYYNRQTVNFNGMINPLVPFGIRGFLWYQGENNASKAKQYAELQPMLIDDWRVRFQQGYLPFLFVQLPNYKSRSDTPLVKDDWAQFRQAQYTTLLRSPNTGMACTIDIGDEFNIHPINKQDVGKRLYLVAQDQVYHQPVRGSGPVFRNATREGSGVRIKFTYAGNGLKLKDIKLNKSFALEDSTGKWYWADGLIEGSDIVVSSEHVRYPVSVQYAWQSNPMAPVYNAEGLPMLPFNEKITQ